MPEPELAVSSPDQSRGVSPELVLVDPELAVRERERLSVRLAALQPVEAEIRSPGVAEGRSPGTPAVETPSRSETRRRSRSLPLLVGTAAAIVVSLLLLDVRVEVGKSPASAESQTPSPDGAALPSTPPVSPAPRSPSSPLKPHPSPKLQDRRFAWAPVKQATGYRVEIHRGPTRIFARETTRPEIEIPRTWKRSGVRQTLRPGEYRWYVWPIVAGRRSTKAVVQASLSIPG